MPTNGDQSRGKTPKPPASRSSPVAELVRRGEWAEAYKLLLISDRRHELNGDDLERLGEAAYMLGREDDFIRAYERAFEDHLQFGRKHSAARCGFWIGLISIFRGEFAQGNGWLTRASRLVADLGAECPEQGYLLLPRVEQLLAAGNPQNAYELANQAAEIGLKFDDDDLLAIARHLQGRIRVESGKTVRGFELLDEAMISVVSGSLSPIVTGLIYCSVIDTCQRFQAVERAREWTSALARWCAGQPDLIAFTGRCLIHRAEILIIDGDWDQARREAEAASARLQQGPAKHHAGAAYYQEGEVFRLRGQWENADAAYRASSRLGFDPQPGLALLRLRQGNLRSALSTIRRALRMVEDDAGKLRLLPAAVEITLAAGDVDEARALCESLENSCRGFSSHALQACVAETKARLLIHDGRAENALTHIRRAMGILLDLRTPYRIACLRVLMARACHAIGDVEAARIELEEAIKVFRELGARPDEASAGQQLKNFSPSGKAILTPRQIQVLHLIAKGGTNSKIAGELGLSERTIDRHVSNILTRLGVPTRAAAIAFAFEHGLIKSNRSG